jgi:predicted NodU family carbamoyl transferase
MDIVGYKSAGHDGTICCIRNNQLVFSLEAEKDSNVRRGLFPHEQFEHVMRRSRTRPELNCGDSLQFGGRDLTGSYEGISKKDIVFSKAQVDGRTIDYACVPHELSHIACAYALSELPKGEAFYALVWEGYIGRFYYVDENFRVERLGTQHVMDYVGVRYSFPYHATGRGDFLGFDAAGKIMALAGLGCAASADEGAARALAQKLMSARITHNDSRVALDGDWSTLYDSFEYLKGQEVDSPGFVAICRALQDAVFERFHTFAERHVQGRRPLLISGGCGLNCEWNTLWRNSDLFSSVFVPPVASDCGIAIGAAAAVQQLHTGSAKLGWDVYAGEEFVEDETDLARHGFVRRPLDLGALCNGIVEQEWVVAWVQGRYELGPRALCHRSLLAAPFSEKTRDRLNQIKRREPFRPIAPVCLEENVSDYFEWTGASPFMLYFQNVRAKQLGAVTHADGTARAQTLNASQDRATHALLQTMRQKTGFGVLCNTSLNHLGRGFINHMSDLVGYVNHTRVDAMVVNDLMYVRQSDASL